MHFDSESTVATSGNAAGAGSHAPTPTILILRPTIRVSTFPVTGVTAMPTTWVPHQFCAVNLKAVLHLFDTFVTREACLKLAAPMDSFSRKQSRILMLPASKLPTM